MTPLRGCGSLSRDVSESLSRFLLIERGLQQAFKLVKFLTLCRRP